MTKNHESHKKRIKDLEHKYLRHDSMNMQANRGLFVTQKKADTAQPSLGKPCKMALKCTIFLENTHDTLKNRCFILRVIRVF